MALSITLFTPILTYSHTITFADNTTCDTLSLTGHSIDGERFSLSLDLHNLSAHMRNILSQISTPKKLTDVLTPSQEPAPESIHDEIPF